MSQLISQRAYARSRAERGLSGGTHAAVQKAIKNGRIRLIDGKIDPEVADIQWDRNTDPAQQKRGSQGGQAVAPPASGSPAALPGAPAQTSAPTNGNGANEDQISRIREAARADAARAELLNWELERKRGNYVRADEVKKMAMDKARIARDALLAIPNRLAPILAAETDVAKVHALITQEVRRVCAELAAGENGTLQ